LNKYVREATGFTTVLKYVHQAFHEATTKRGATHDEPTHEVFNQVTPLIGGYDLFESDKALAEGVERFGGSWAHSQLQAHGKTMGSFEMMKHGDLANRFPPVLRTHDREFDLRHGFGILVFVR
jgi:hypothetical protein